MMKLKAPYPWFGGKSRVAEMVWDRLGDPDNVIEPFFGSGAVLLLRPHPPRIETVNDLDSYVANFWRATQHAPEAVAEYADGPVNEVDLHARHRWLVLSDHAAEFRKRMRTEPDYFDAKVAGWWCWGLCCWIGSGWCSTVERAESEKIPEIGGGRDKGASQRGVHAKTRKLDDRSIILGGGEGQYGHGRSAEWNQRPLLTNNGLGQGVHGANRPQLADAFSRGRGVHGNDDAGTCAQRRAWLLDWFGRLRDRLRTVRVCCGDWLRVCDSESVTTRLGVTGLFLDPPYGAKADRTSRLYSTDSLTVAEDVRKYCLERGGDPAMRIALAGYAGEGHEVLEQHGWECIAWASPGGYGNRSQKGKDNAKKERLWFSPHCVDLGTPLFEGLE